MNRCVTALAFILHLLILVMKFEIANNIDGAFGGIFFKNKDVYNLDNSKFMYSI